MFRISSIVRTLEDQTIKLGGKVAAASKQLYTEASQEARVRAMYHAETKGEREARLADLRDAVRATDAAFEARRSQPDERDAQIAELKKQLASARRAATRARNGH